jgi:hypothetical protein
MEQTSIPDDEPHSRLGYSIGEWEDESTLVVYTARINWPYFDGDGTRQSEQVEAVERFSLSDDGRELTYHLTSRTRRRSRSQRRWSGNILRWEKP